MCHVICVDVDICTTSICPADVEIFYRLSENFDLNVALEEKSKDHQSHENESCTDCDGVQGIPRAMLLE